MTISIGQKIYAIDVDSERTIPAGAIGSFPVSSAPAGWLECRGQTVSGGPLLSDLWDAIGIDYGEGERGVRFIKSISISLWFRKDSTPGTQKILIDKWNGNYRSYSIHLSSGGIPVFYLSKAGTDYYGLSSSTNVCDGNWHHIVAGYKYDTHERAIFIDNVLRNYSTNFSSKIFDSGNNSNLYIGYANNTWLECDVADIRIYNKALEYSEITDLYNKIDISDKLALHYDFSTATYATSATDMSGNNNHGIVEGLPVSASPPIGISNALRLNGINNRIDGGNKATWMTLPDYRGYFLRHRDNGAGIDVDNSAYNISTNPMGRIARTDGTLADSIGSIVGTTQESKLLNHDHSGTRYGCTNIINPGAYTPEKGAGHYNTNESNVIEGRSTSYSVGIGITNTNEITPKNMSVLYCIKY